CRVEAAEHHGLHGEEAGERRGGGPLGVGDRVADLGVAHLLDGRHEDADLARAERGDLDRARREHADPRHEELLPGRHHADAPALRELAVEDAHQHDRAVVGVEPRVEDERGRGRVGVAPRRRDVAHDGFQDVGGADALLGARQDGVRGVEADHLLDLPAHLLGLGARQVDLVDDRHDGEVVVERQVDVGERLRLHALRGVDHQDGALAGGQAARDLIGEVDVAGRVDQVEDVVLAAAPVTQPAASAEAAMERRVPDAPTRPRRDVYAELLVTVGLFAIPAALNAVYAYVAGELHYGTVGIGWLFASRAAQELLLIGLFFYVLRANGERLSDFT